MRAPVFAAWLVLATVASGCGGGSDGCVDLDGDGFGSGCDAGVDCDDTNAARTMDCETVPPPDCEATPTATGCPCLFSTVAACYSGPTDTRGVAACIGGTTRCLNGHFGLCVGEVVPRSESCNGADDDCDGYVDEGVRSPCGGCDPMCHGGVWGEAPAPFVPGNGTAVTDQGELTLARVGGSTGGIFVANSAEDTVSRIDPVAAAEVARYPSGGDDPGRIAVDYLGDAWILNRAFGGQSTVRRIAGQPARCVDADMSGAVDTSTGPTDVLVNDECVLLTADVGDPSDTARAIAIDGSAEDGGDPWVGLYEGQAIVHLASETGAEIERIETPGFHPYGAAFDPWGTLWMIEREGRLLRLDRRSSPPTPEIVTVPFACFHLYGLAIDAEGRLLLTGFDCDQAILYEPAIHRFRPLSTPPSTRGAVVDGDFGWIAHTDGRATRLRISPFVVDETFDLASGGLLPIESIGITTDDEGDVWVASTSGGVGGVGLATELDPVSDAHTQVPVGLGPHVQGDLNGRQLLGGFVPTGDATYVFAGCGALPTIWRAIHLEADAGAAGSVEVAVRHAPSTAELPAASFTVIGTFPSDAVPYPLTLPRGGSIEVRLVLRTTARDGAPRVRRVGVEWSCGIT